jgi:cell pole-organizing protein PopZ
MEEILASIRRIISEDEAPAEAGPVIPESEPVSAKREHEFSSSESTAEIEASDDRSASSDHDSGFNSGNEIPGLPGDEDDDDAVLELTQKVETHGDLDVLAPTDSGSESESEFEPEPEPQLDAEPIPPLPLATLVSDEVAAEAAAHFGQLSGSMLLPAYGRTLEDLLREMLNPMLKTWLDGHLPGIVQEAVQAEVERIARGRPR